MSDKHPTGPAGPTGASGAKPGGNPSLRLNLSQQPSASAASASAASAASGNSNRPSESTSASASASASAPVPPPASKKRRFTPQSVAPHAASAANLTVLHQNTQLHFVLQQHLPVASTSTSTSSSTSTSTSTSSRSQNQYGYSDPTWYAEGHTTLYVIDRGVSVAGGGSVRQMALHLRGSCQVTDVTVECLTNTDTNTNTGTDTNTNTSNGPNTVLLPSTKLRSSVQHADPLHHVLVKPAVSYTEDDAVHGNINNNSNNNTNNNNAYKFDADAQSSRGAAGMTTGLRAASMASNMGEIRLTVDRPTAAAAAAAAQGGGLTAPVTLEMAATAWKNDILQHHNNATEQQTDGNVVRSLRESLQERSPGRRNARIALMAKRLAEATCSKEKGNRAFKISIRYQIPLNKSILHLGGLHALTTNGTPHIYTTSGVVGDHEGPRCWIPCLDSASSEHRASHELSVHVTAPLRHGISCVGLGEDMGCSNALLHDVTWNDNVDAAKEELGVEHVAMLQAVARKVQDNRNHAATAGTGTAHVIPPDAASTTNPMSSLSIDDVRVTAVWCSCSWTPIPARSLGFAIGPFKVLEDLEYFGPGAIIGDEDEGNGVSLEERHQAFVDAARDRGEGIRQVYFAPLFERKHIHVDADSRLLPDTVMRLAPLNAQQKEVASGLQKVMHYATVGVVHRSLSLMRDVLALPSYRTSSYTQVWIPNAVHGGVTSGALHDCPEVMVNAFLGGAILDARLLPPVGSRLPYYQGGRVLQFLQARCAVRGWVTSTLPLGPGDDVGSGYIFSLIESFLMSMYERSHGAHGEGGAKGGLFYSKRYAAGSGLNSSNLDFLPVRNIEEIDVVPGGVAAIPVEERQNDHLWRSASNGSESHTSTFDEFNVRQLLCKDVIEAIERGTDKDKGVPTPSMGWLGSHLSLSFLSSNATSSSDIGCGAVELVHPMGGLVYRALKSEVLRGVVEGRAGVANFIRLVRAAFIASHLDDLGEKEIKLPARREKKSDREAKPDKEGQRSGSQTGAEKKEEAPKPPFVVCVNEIMKKKGLTHTLFTRALQNLSGRTREPHLLGTLVDVERHAEDPRTRRPFVDPEGFPNSYVRGPSLLYCRVGVQVEQARESSSSQAQSGALVAKGIQMQAYAEPIIPQGGIAFGGPITIRVVENEGQFREYVKELKTDGSRRDWGATFLHAKPVTQPKDQTAASGTIDSSSSTAKEPTKSPGGQRARAPTLGESVANRAFTANNFHVGGYQAIELIRLTNLTPLLWVRVDPLGLYGGRISVFQPDACLAEQLFHDGDSSAQVSAIRALAERPLRIQGSMKVTSIYDVSVAELPVRILGDCLRGSPALHSSLPHTPAVRCQAALAIAQWQNNKAPNTKDAVMADNWVGLSLLIQYFRERFYSNAVVMPVKFSRLALRRSEIELRQEAAATAEAGAPNPAPNYDDAYQYLDTLEEGEERAGALADAEEVEMEEDEEYRVRSAVITAIASIRAKDGMTPPLAIQFLETVIEGEDAEMVGKLMFPDEELMVEKTFRQMRAQAASVHEEPEVDDATEDDRPAPSLNYVPSMLVADALLSLCYVNSSPALIMNPTTGKPVQASGKHPVTRLMELARGWLDWELYREKVRSEVALESLTGVSGNCHDTIAACAITALSSLAILRQSTMDSLVDEKKKDVTSIGEDGNASQQAFLGQNDKLHQVSTAQFYVDIFDSEPQRNDLTKAACAQAIVCICCAADRFEKESVQPVGLLTALEFLLDRIIDDRTSPSLRHTLGLIIMDACTGKVSSMQRVGAIAGRNDLVSSATRFLNGSLGASDGGDNGSALLVSVSAASFPAANAVNDGARRGLRLLSRAGHPRETLGYDIIVRVAIFSSRMWRTINGEPADPPEPPETPRQAAASGVCAFDGALRCTLLAMWQWVWPRGCFAVLQVQAWKTLEGTQRYEEMGAHRVMKISEEEKAAAAAEDASLADINRLVNLELDRQAWRGEMAQKAYDMFKSSKQNLSDVAAAEQGIGQPLPPIQRDSAFKQGGWVASAAQQRRALALDGGTAVTKLRLTVKNTADA